MVKPSGGSSGSVKRRAARSFGRSSRNDHRPQWVVSGRLPERLERPPCHPDRRMETSLGSKPTGSAPLYFVGAVMVIAVALTRATDAVPT